VPGWRPHDRDRAGARNEPHAGGRRRTAPLLPRRLPTAQQGTQRVRITLLVGNPKPESRTLRVCQLLARQLAPVDSTAMATIDLATHTSELFAWPSPAMTALMDQVASSELLLVA